MQLPILRIIVSLYIENIGGALLHHEWVILKLKHIGTHNSLGPVHEQRNVTCTGRSPGDGNERPWHLSHILSRATDHLRSYRVLLVLRPRINIVIARVFDENWKTQLLPKTYIFTLLSFTLSSPTFSSTRLYSVRSRPAPDRPERRKPIRRCMSTALP